MISNREKLLSKCDLNTFFKDPYNGFVLVDLCPNLTGATGLPGAGPGLTLSAAEPL